MKDIDNIQYLLAPKSIAILGCSPANAGGTTLQNLMRNGYAGKLYPVHPKNAEVFGLKCYPALADIPGEVDCCVIALNSGLILDALEQLHQKGVKACLMYASGFAELGAEGKALQAKISQKLREYGIAACGPNCLGLLNFHQGIAMYNASVDITGKAGPLGLVAHSGSACIAMTSAGRGIGFSTVVSCGNEAGLSVADYFRAMVEDENTRVMVGYLEAIRNPAALAQVAALAVQKGKPLIILKVGRSAVGQKTAAAHSGALASSTAVIDAFFRKNHILTAGSFDELFEMCEILLKLKDTPPKVDTIGLTAISGGQLGFSSDIAEVEGVRFGEISEATKKNLADVLPGYATASNPLDVTTALFEPDTYRACIKALAADPAVGLVLVCQDCEIGLETHQTELYEGILKGLVQSAKEIDKPLAIFSPLGGGLHPALKKLADAGGVPLMQGANAAMHAVRALLCWTRYRQEAATPAGDAPEKRDFDFGPDASLSERASKQLLLAYGIPAAGDELVQSEDEAVAAAGRMGYPVVLKVDSPDILHKTEAGIVRLGLADADAVRLAYREIIQNAKTYDAKARISGVSVQEQVPKGVEMMLGVKNDPAFGPAVMVGVGGIFVEVFKDVSLRLAPLDLATAHQMLAELKGVKLLQGARGAEAADMDALADAVVRLGHIAAAHADTIAEMDINPLIVLPKGRGVKAVDALVVQKTDTP